MRDLDLAAYGLAWCKAPAVLAHALADGGRAVLCTDVADTAALLDQDAPGDGEAWLRLYQDWTRVREPLLDALFTPVPAVGPATRLLRTMGAAGTLEFARLAVLPVRRLAEENFREDAAALLLTGKCSAQRPGAASRLRRRFRLAAGDAGAGRRLPSPARRRRPTCRGPALQSGGGGGAGVVWDGRDVR